MTKARVVSGIRPTGSVHLGNYLGAIRNAAALQDEHEGFYFIADLHAVTEEYDHKFLSRHTYQTAALYLACGIDPDRSTLFVQSHVPAHCVLARCLGSIAPFGTLSRMVQFKEKAVRQKQQTSLGLFDYPVLMAADILAYNPKLVPVGADQKQHLELAQTLAKRFNSRFETEVFTVPKPLVMPAGARIMSLTDGESKMSKSDPDENSRINLLDGPDTIKEKIRFAKTDSHKEIEFNKDRPAVNNLLTIYHLVSGKTREQVAAECGDIGFGKFKQLLVDALVAYLEPIQKRYAAIYADSSTLIETLARGSKHAGEIADETVSQARRAMGLVPRPF